MLPTNYSDTIKIGAGFIQLALALVCVLAAAGVIVPSADFLAIILAGNAFASAGAKLVKPQPEA